MGLQAAGCGPNETTFDVEIDKKLHTTGQPANGKALVYVFADEAADNAKLVVGPVITRIGSMANGWAHSNLNPTCTSRLMAETTGCA